MNKGYKSISSSVICMVLAAVLFVACDENELDPIDRDTGIYGMYGALDLNKQVNYIRVKDLNAEFTEAATETIDATVTFENLESGAVQTLGSETLKWEDIYLHNFIVNGPIAPDTRYRVKAERSDGVEVAIETLTPTMPVPQANPISEDCHTPITVTFEPTNGSTIGLKLGFLRGDTLWRVEQIVQADQQNSNRISYTFVPQDELDLFPPGNQTILCNELSESNVFVAYVHYSPGFYEKIKNDPFDILASTDRLGALYYDTLAIPIDTSRVCPQDCQPEE